MERTLRSKNRCRSSHPKLGRTATQNENVFCLALPDEIILSILARLPVKSLLRFKCVCKLWNSLISERKFCLSDHPQRKRLIFCHSDKQSTFYSVNCHYKIEALPSPLKKSSPQCRFLGGCRGVLLVSVGPDIYMWNPSTRNCTKVLELEDLQRDFQIVIPGFCHDQLTDDFVAVIGFFHFYKPCAVLAASLKGKTWKEIAFPYFLDSTRGGPVVNERLHWIICDNPNAFGRADADGDYAAILRVFMSRGGIVYFDPQLSEFKSLPGPDPMSFGEVAITSLGVLQDCLCIAGYVLPGAISDCLQVLIMKDYGVKESWSTLFVIRGYISDMRMFFSLEEKEILIASRHELVSYNFTEAKRNAEWKFRNSLQAQAISESLVSPSDYSWDESRKMSCTIAPELLCN